MRRGGVTLSPHGTIVLLVLAVVVASCEQQRFLTTTADSNCSRRFSGEKYENPLLSMFAVDRTDIALAVLRAQDERRAADRRARVETVRKPTAVASPAEAELAKVEAELTRKKAGVEAANRKLDEMEARIEAGRAQLGDCFGVGVDGEEAAKRYAEAKEGIGWHRNVVSREFDQAMERRAAAAARNAYIEHWRAENARYLRKKTADADLEIVEVGRWGGGMRVVVAITNSTSSIILRPSVGVLTEDNFGNSYKLYRVRSRGLTSGSGIRPGKTVYFELRYREIPLENALFIRIVFVYEPGQWVLFDMPAEVFFGGMSTSR